MMSQSSVWCPQISSPLVALQLREPNATRRRMFFSSSRSRASGFLLHQSVPRAGNELVWKPQRSGVTCGAKLDGHSEHRGHSEPNTEAGSRSFFGMIIDKALEAYLRTKLERCRELRISVTGKNQELVSGQVRRVEVFAKGVVYKGLALTDVHLQSSPLKFQIGKNKPLLHPFNVSACIRIREDDLNFSLSSPLLSNALSDVVPANWDVNSRIPELSVAIRDGYLHLMNKQPEQSMGLCLALNDGGKSLRVSSVPSGDDETDLIERRFGLTGVQISNLEVDMPFLFVEGDFAVTP